MKRGAQMAILETAFEPDGDGYLYYHNRWAPGIPVTVEEREAYISIPVAGFAARREWSSRIRQRAPTAPRRPSREAMVRLRAAMPLAMTIWSFLFGAMFVLVGIGSDGPWWPVVLIGGGGALILNAGANILARWRLRP